MTADLEVSSSTPTLVQRASGLSDNDANWTTMPWAVVRTLRRLVGPAFGSADIDLIWGEIHDPNAGAAGVSYPAPPLDVDDLVRLVKTTIDEQGNPVAGTTIWYGVVETVDDSDPTRAKAKANDLGILLARTYLTRGWELNGGGTTLVDPGFLPAFNGQPGGDRSASIWNASGCYIHDRRGSGSPWTAFQIAELLLRRGMLPDLPGAPTGVAAVAWQLDPASATDYVPECQDFSGLSIAEAIDRLFNARRGLTWRITVSGAKAQVLVIDLDAAGTDLDTTGDLGWATPRVQRRRDGFDYVLVSGARPCVGMTLWWTAGGSTGSLEPDGWTPGGAADTALDAALLAELDGAAYNGPEYRRFKIRAGWNGLNYDQTEIGLRSDLFDGDAETPLDGSRNWQAVGPPPNTLEIERHLPCAPGFTSSADGPRQAPVVIAGKAGSWQDLSATCRPTPISGCSDGERSDQGTAVIMLGESAEDAAALRAAIGADGTLLVSIGIREWAPLQCAWTAPADDWSQLSPRVYHLKRKNTEEWLCLQGTVTGVVNGTLTTLPAIMDDIRSDITKLQTLRDQLRVRFGNTVTGATITRQGEIMQSWNPGAKLAILTLVDGRTYTINMPCTSVEIDFDACSTTLRWSPILDEKPKA